MSTAWALVVILTAVVIVVMVVVTSGTAPGASDDVASDDASDGSSSDDESDDGESDDASDDGGQTTVGTPYTLDADLSGYLISPEGTNEQGGAKFFKYRTDARQNEPTQGVVWYGAYPELITYDNNRIQIRVQTSGKANPNDYPHAIRLESRGGYDKGVFIIDAVHIPEGYGVWPSFWLTSKEGTWACNGEIDIIEGVNSIDDKSSRNASTLHTSDLGDRKCRQDGVPGISNRKCSAGGGGNTCGCDAKQPCPTEGCGVHLSNTKSFGKGFNDNGGGVYAAELNSDGRVTVWFFPRGQIPPELGLGAAPKVIDPSRWPINDNTIRFNACPGSFKQMQIVLNTTLCGSWAGGGSGTSTQCGKDIVSGKYDKALEKAYWDINYIRLYR